MGNRKLITHESGAVRNDDAGDVRYDLISPHGLHRLAQTCAEGAAAYGDHNWVKGLPGTDLLNRTVRHVYAYIGGDRSEDHLAHAAWNLFAFMHFQVTRPELTQIGPPSEGQANEQRFWLDGRPDSERIVSNTEAGGRAFDALGRRVSIRQDAEADEARAEPGLASV